MMTSQSGSWRFGGVTLIVCCIAFSLLGRAHCQTDDATARVFTERVDPGLQTVDYIIIGVTSAAVAGSLTLLLVVVIMNRKKQNDKNKVIPTGDTLEARPDEENAIITKSMSAADDAALDDDPIG